MSVSVASPPTSNLSPGARYVSGLLELLGYYVDRGLREDEVTIPELRFAIALARYRFSPPGGRMVAERVHVMSFGGAGAGKSTLTNIVVGADVAEINAQAGYTRHPIAFIKSDVERAGELWPDYLGMLERYDSAEPANIDEHRYGWRRLLGDLVDPGFLRRHVVWDCPDLTAKDATHYQSRVIEIAGLAHVCVYVASDERYNDELPTNFLQAMLDAGKYVVVVLTKVSPTDADELMRLFQSQVLKNLRNGDRILEIVPIPCPPPGKFSSLWTESMPYGSQIREAIEKITGDFAELQLHSRQSAARYLLAQQSRLLDPLRQDLAEWRSWIELVRQAANEAVVRYEREYLARVQHRELQHAHAELLSIFMPKGIFEFVGKGLELLRTPYRMLKNLWKRFSPIQLTSEIDEERAIEKVRRGMLESLQVMSATRKARHPLWSDLHQSLHQDAVGLIEPAFHKLRDKQRRQLEDQLLNVGQSIRSDIERIPMATLGLQTARVFLDLLAVAAAVYVGGLYPITILLVLLCVGGVEELVHIACHFYVNRHRASLIRQQKENIRELIQVAYIDSLVQLPMHKGRRLHGLSTLTERLETELKTIMADLGAKGRP
ncbi:MAG: GTPase domain-containing protein [Planctomycetota bacterium]